MFPRSAVSVSLVGHGSSYLAVIRSDFRKELSVLSFPASACRVETEKISVLPAARDAVIWAVFLPELSFLKFFRRVETDTVRVPPTAKMCFSEGCAVVSATTKRVAQF